MNQSQRNRKFALSQKHKLIHKKYYNSWSSSNENRNVFDNGWHEFILNKKDMQIKSKINVPTLILQGQFMKNREILNV